jgi:hypothetical protein
VSATPLPGWYPDPAGTDELFRWWDGQCWTDAISESPFTPGPGLTAGANRTQGPGGSADSPRTAYAVLPRRVWSIKVFCAVMVGFAVFIATAIGVGFLFWRETGTPTPIARHLGGATTGPISPSATTAFPMGQLDESTGLATIGPASMLLPGAPYVLYDHPIEVSGVFDVLFQANAQVHTGYRSSQDWSAMVALAQLSSPVSSSPDLAYSGSVVLGKFSQRFFGGARTTLRHLSYSDRSVDGHPGLLFTADVDYAIKQLPSRYDTVSALVVRLDDGSTIVAISSIPDDAGPELVRLAARSLESLSTA